MGKSSWALKDGQLLYYQATNYTTSLFSKGLPPHKELNAVAVWRRGAALHSKSDCNIKTKRIFGTHTELNTFLLLSRHRVLA